MIVHRIHISDSVKNLSVTSVAFKEHCYIPSKYTSDGENINPPLSIHEIPKNTKSLVLLVEDPDAMVGTWIHWVVWNIKPSGEILEKSVPGIEGINDFRKRHYCGPCPPSGIHRYYFKVYALNGLLDLNSTATILDLEKAMTPLLIAFGEIMGVYRRY